MEEHAFLLGRSLFRFNLDVVVGRVRSSRVRAAGDRLEPVVPVVDGLSFLGLVRGRDGSWRGVHASSALDSSAATPEGVLAASFEQVRQSAPSERIDSHHGHDARSGLPREQAEDRVDPGRVGSGLSSSADGRLLALRSRI